MPDPTRGTSGDDPAAGGKGRWRDLGPVYVLAGLAVVLPVVGMVVLRPYLVDAGGQVGELGRLAPLVAIALGAALAGLAVLPTFVVSLTAGYVFGFALGTPVAALALAGATLINYTLVRRLRAGRLGEVVGRSALARAVAHELAGRGGWRTTLAVTLVRLPPQLPFALVTLVAAGLSVPRLPLVAGTLVGMGPRVALMAWVGGSLSDWQAAVASGEQAAGVVYGLVAGVAGLGGMMLWGWLILRRLKTRHAPAA